MLIGISGAARHGKDTIGAVLRDDYGFTVRKFAEPLYALGQAARGVAPDGDTDNTREELVALGNTIRRYDPEFLTRAAKRHVEQHQAEDIVYTDVRDEYEMRWIRRHGTLFFVERPDFDSGITDIDGLDKFLPHAKRCASHRFCNYGSVEQLRRLVRFAMQNTEIRPDYWGTQRRVWLGDYLFSPQEKHNYGY